MRQSRSHINQCMKKSTLKGTSAVKAIMDKHAHAYRWKKTYLISPFAWSTFKVDWCWKPVRDLITDAALASTSWSGCVCREGWDHYVRLGDTYLVPLNPRQTNPPPSVVWTRGKLLGSSLSKLLGSSLIAKVEACSPFTTDKLKELERTHGSLHCPQANRRVTACWRTVWDGHVFN